MWSLRCTEYLVLLFFIASKVVAQDQRPIRINAGSGRQYRDSKGDIWSADDYFSRGKAFSELFWIFDTQDRDLYRSNRYDTENQLTYDIPITNGNYIVKLHFAELYSGAQARGARIFDVFIEGEKKISDLDIYAEVGGYTALIKETTVQVNDKELSLSFGRIIENPLICAIEIYSSGEPYVEPPPPASSKSSSSSSSSTPDLGEEAPRTPAPTPSPTITTMIEPMGGMAVWAKNREETMRYSDFDGSSFVSVQTGPNVRFRWSFVRGASAPTRDEMIVVGITDQGTNGDSKVTAVMWDGNHWGRISIDGVGSTLGTVSSPFWNNAQVAYESQSGDAILIWNDSGRLRYSKWNGETWTHASLISGVVGEPQWLDIAASLTSNEIVVALSDSSNRVYALVWDSMQWKIPFLISTGSHQAGIAIAYESQSGHAMVVYGKYYRSSGAWYRRWDGSRWSSEDFFESPFKSSIVRWAVLRAISNSNQLVLGVHNGDKGVWLSVWDGSSWDRSATIAATTTSSGTETNVQSVMYVGVESQSGDAVAVYRDRFVLRYRTLRRGSGSWSSSYDIPGYRETPTSMTLDSEQGSNRLMLMVQDDDGDIHSVQWDGNKQSWNSIIKLESETGEWKNQPFLFLWKSRPIIPKVSAVPTDMPSPLPTTSPSSSPTNTPFGVDGFVLVDADENRDIEGALACVPVNACIGSTSRFNIRAEVSGKNIQGVVMSLNGAVTGTRRDLQPPYSVFGDRDGRFRGKPLSAGNYSITAFAFNENGDVSQNYTASFEIVNSPSQWPSQQPSQTPSDQPSTLPSKETLSETPSYYPTVEPSDALTADPTIAASAEPSVLATEAASSEPSALPSQTPSQQVTVDPTEAVSKQPSMHPSGTPSQQVTVDPTESASSEVPSNQPSQTPSQQVTADPTQAVSKQPSIPPSGTPSQQVTVDPTEFASSGVPSIQPSETPSLQVTADPTQAASEQPSIPPSGAPSQKITVDPTEAASSEVPSIQPSARPPSSFPSIGATKEPTGLPTQALSLEPSLLPSIASSTQPSETASTEPSQRSPTNIPSSNSPVDMAGPAGPSALDGFDPIYINCGGDEFTDANGTVWQADKYFVLGAKAEIQETHVVYGTSNPELYRTERWLNTMGRTLVYDIPVPNGEYSVTVHLSENYERLQKIGSRRFSVSMEDEVVFPDLDIFAESGSGYTALTKTKTVSVTDENLTIGFARIVQNPKVSGIEVHSSLNAPYPDSVPVESTPTTSPTEKPTIGGAAEFVPIRINAGGDEAYTDTKNVLWIADRYFDGGESFVTNEKINGTDDQALFQTGRFDEGSNLIYNIPVPDGGYLVSLYFVDSFPETQETAQRIFDVEIEGFGELKDIDIFAAVGGYAVLKRQAPVAVADQSMTIELISVVEDPVISAIEIERLETSAPRQAHAVAGGPYVATLASADASVASVTVDGSFSHSHGKGAVIISWKWRLDGKLVGSEPTLTLELQVDSYSLTLDVVDSDNSKSSATTTITVRLPPLPKITSLRPDTVNVAGGDTVVISGSGFTASESETTVYFGSTPLSGSSLITVLDESAIEIKQVPPSVAGVIEVRVETQFGISNNGTFTYIEGTPIAFSTGVIIPDIYGPTCIATGPDGNLYIGTQVGSIVKAEVNDKYEVVRNTTSFAIPASSDTFRSILGITFDPMDTSENPAVYVSHSTLFHGKLKSYNGKVSRISGEDLSVVEDIITGLPVSDLDHGINGLEFGDFGELYVQVGANTNAGVPGPLSSTGRQEDGIFSGATLVAYLNRTNFDGKVKYDSSENQISGFDVELFAVGQRNPYDLVLHSNGYLYATDNGANFGFGRRSVTCDTDEMDPLEVDELNLLERGKYYGQANRKRGETDPRQCRGRSQSEPSDDEYTAPIVLLESSTDGIIEFQSDHFDGQLRGRLILGEYKGGLYEVELSSDGRSTVNKQATLLSEVGGLSLTQGPDGTLFVVRNDEGEVIYVSPKDQSCQDICIKSVFPRRGPESIQSLLTIYGDNLNQSGTPTVMVGGKPCPIVGEVRDSKITCRLPTGKGTADIVVTVGSQTATFVEGYRYISGTEEESRPQV